MKKVTLFASAVLAAACVSLSNAAAQTIESGYFLDNYSFSYRLNPAIMNDNNFISLGLGNISAGISSKFGVATFLYPGPDGRLVTGFNKAVTSTEFLSKLSKSNMVGENVNVNLLAFGIRKENSLSTIEVNVREDIRTSVPRDLFAFLKEGSSSAAYDMSSFRAGANAMVEIALGHTRRFDNLVFGLRAKLLFGAARGEVSFNRFNVTSNEGKIGVSADARIKVACEPLEIVGSSDNPLYVDDVRFALEHFGVAGFGVGFDLGAKWYINDNMSATFGINDLGAMSWKYNNVLKADFDASYTGLENVDADTDVDAEFDKIWKEIEDKAKINKAENAKELEFLPFKMNAGVRYRLPFYDRLSVGVLATYEHSTFANIFSSRLGATVTPINWFSLTGNLGVSNYGALAGCMASLTLAGINFFGGFDTYIGKCSAMDFKTMGLDLDPNFPIQKCLVPLNSFQYKFNFGLTIQFGKRFADYIHND